MNYKVNLPQPTLDVKQLADYFQCSERTIHTLKEKNGMPFFRIGRQIRFDLDEIKAWRKGGGNGN